MEGGGEEKPLNAPRKMLLLPATPINKLYNPKHEESCASTTKPLATILPQSPLVVNSVKYHLTSSKLAFIIRILARVNGQTIQIPRGTSSDG